MAQVKRESANKTSDISGGPYLAKIISHLDPTFMGGLEVTLLRPDGNSIGDGGQTYGVRYASPFAGQTAFEFQGYNVYDFNDKPFIYIFKDWDTLPAQKLVQFYKKHDISKDFFIFSDVISSLAFKKCLTASEFVILMSGLFTISSLHNFFSFLFW